MTEGNSGTVDGDLHRHARRASGRTVTVDYATADGTATAPGDYLAASGTVTFLPGETSRPVTVTVNGDTLDEANETYLVNLSNADERDDPRRPGARHDHRRRRAADGLGRQRDRHRGQQRARQRHLHRQPELGPSGQAVTVDYATADGTATAPADYTATSGTRQLPARRDDEDRSPSRSRATRSTRRTRRSPSTCRTPTNATIADGTAWARSPTTTRRPRSRSTTSR